MAVCGFSSTLSLATVILSEWVSAIFWTTGAIMRQGAHHSAQKSTSTGLAPETSLSKSASVAVIVFSDIVMPAAGRPLPPRVWRPAPWKPAVVSERTFSFIRLQPPLGVDGGGAAHPGRGHRLPVGEVHHVSGAEDPPDGGSGVVERLEVSALVAIPLTREQRRVRILFNHH